MPLQQSILIIFHNYHIRFSRAHYCHQSTTVRVCRVGINSTDIKCIPPPDDASGFTKLKCIFTLASLFDQCSLYQQRSLVTIWWRAVSNSLDSGCLSCCVLENGGIILCDFSHTLVVLRPMFGYVKANIRIHKMFSRSCDWTDH